MVEGARLESVYRGNSIEGSNPSLSASLNLVLVVRVVEGVPASTGRKCVYPPFRMTRSSQII